METPDTTLRWCGRCQSRGYVLCRRHQGDGIWGDARALCPECAGLSVRDVEALLRQAAQEGWLRRRYPGTDHACWDAYDWRRDRWMDDRPATEGAA